MSKRKITASMNYARARLKLGLSHHEMGKLLGIQHTTSMRWESGDRGPPLYITALMVAIREDEIGLPALEAWMEKAREKVSD